MNQEPDYVPPQVVILPNGRMTPDNAALYLGIAAKTLAMKRCDGTGPKFTKVGGRVFYSKKALDEWMDEHGEFSSTSQARVHQQMED